MPRERKGDDEEGTQKRMNPVLQGDGRGENEEAREKVGESNAAEREDEQITRGEEQEERRCTRAGMSRLLVSQTRGRYLEADQWQSTERPGIFVGSSVAVAD